MLCFDCRERGLLSHVRASGPFGSVSSINAGQIDMAWIKLVYDAEETLIGSTQAAIATLLACTKSLMETGCMHFAS